MRTVIVSARMLSLVGTAVGEGVDTTSSLGADVGAYVGNDDGVFEGVTTAAQEHLP